jgi:hypothetical protein
MMNHLEKVLRNDVSNFGGKTPTLLLEGKEWNGKA